MTASALFSPLALGPVQVSNRIVISPMCQYSADDGSASDWHLQHLMTMAMSGAGLVMVEATAVPRQRGEPARASLPDWGPIGGRGHGRSRLDLQETAQRDARADRSED